MRPYISVIIPVYNVEPFLSKCLDSVISQTMENIEIICVYEPSKDNSFEVLKSYEEKDNRISVFCNSQVLGLSCTRNVGLKHAQGKYVYFIDSDDWIEPDTLEKAFSKAEETSAEVVAFGAYVHYEDNSDKSNYMSLVNPEFNAQYPDVMPGSEAFSRMTSNNELFSMVWMNLYKKRFLDDSGLTFCEGCLHEDRLFYALVLLKAKSMSIINEKFYHYRRNMQSITSLKNIDLIKEILSYVKMYTELLKVADEHRNSKNEREIVSKNLNAYVDTIKAFYRDLSSEEVRRLWSEYLNFEEKIFINSIIDSYMTLLLASGIKERTKDCNKIYIYGAGKIASKLYPELIDLGIYAEDILVTNKSDRDTFCGKSIRCIKEMKAELDEKTAIIIGVGSKLEDEVLKELEALNIESRIIRIDFDFLKERF